MDAPGRADVNRTPMTPPMALSSIEMRPVPCVSQLLSSFQSVPATNNDDAPFPGVLEGAAISALLDETIVRK